MTENGVEREREKEREGGDDMQQRATCKSGTLSHCSQDTASVH